MVSDDIISLSFTLVFVLIILLEKDINLDIIIICLKVYVIYMPV